MLADAIPREVTVEGVTYELIEPESGLVALRVAEADEVYCRYRPRGFREIWQTAYFDQADLDAAEDLEGFIGERVKVAVHELHAQLVAAYRYMLEHWEGS